MRKIYQIRWFLLLVALLAIFLYRQIFLGEVFYCCDNLLISIPTKLYFVDSLKHGVFPLWNPYIFSGMPFLADINIGLLNPLNITYAIFTPFQALRVFVVLSILIGAFGMYSFGRQLKLSPIGALISASIFGFSGTIIVYTNNTSLLAVASLTPWVLWAFIGYLEKNSSFHLIPLVLLMSFQILAAHPQLTYLTWLLLFGLLIQSLTGSDPARKIFSAAKAFVLTILVSAVQLVPFLESVRSSTRITQDYSYATFDSLHPLNLLRLLLPSVVGNAAQGTAWAQGGSVYGYVGVVALVLAWLAPKKEKIVKFFWVVTVGSVVLAFGKYTPLYYIVYRLTPGLGSFRSPEHFLFLYTIAIALLAGIGSDQIIKKQFETSKKIIIAVMATFSAFLGVLFIARRPIILVLLVLSNISHLAIVKFSNIEPSVFATIVRDIGWNFLFISLILFIFLLTILRSIPGLPRVLPRRIKQSNNIKKTILILLIFSELFIYSRRNIFTLPESQVRNWFSTANSSTMFSPLNKGNDRILISPDVYPYLHAKKFGKNQLSEESAWQVKIVRPNLNMLYGLSSIDGYASLIYKPYQDWLGTKVTDPTGVNLHGVSQEKLNFLGVRYVLLKGLKITENKNALPRVFLVHKGKISSEGITIKSYTPNKVTLSVNTKSNGQLVFMDTNYPGWKAEVSGKNVPIEPYEKVFKSVPVSAGKHTVTFSFLPQSVFFGAVLTLTGMAIFMGIAVSELKERR